MTATPTNRALDLTGLEAVLFDLDGTLLDSNEDLLRSVDHGFMAAGFEPPPRNSSAALLGAPLEEMPRELGITMNPDQMASFCAAFRKHYPEHWLDNSSLFDAVPELLEALAARYRLALVTTKRQEQADRICEVLGIARFFAHIQGFQKGLRHKPAPDLVLEALKGLKLPPGAAVMVGDTHRDLLAGKAAGCRTLAVAWGCGSRELLEAHSPDGFFDSISGLRDLLLA